MVMKSTNTYKPLRVFIIFYSITLCT